VLENKSKSQRCRFLCTFFKKWDKFRLRICHRACFLFSCTLVWKRLSGLMFPCYWLICSVLIKWLHILKPVFVACCFATQSWTAVVQAIFFYFLFPLD